MVINTSNNFNASLNTKLFDFLRIKLLWIWNEVNAHTKKILILGCKCKNNKFYGKRYLVHKNPMDLSFCNYKFQFIFLNLIL